MRSIRESEDELFARWFKERERRRPFATDGWTTPEKFPDSAIKVVFLLKERNWGYDEVAQREEEEKQHDGPDSSRYDFQSDWWRGSIGKWNLAIQFPEMSWNDLKERASKHRELKGEELSRYLRTEVMTNCGIVQAKKSPGGGTVSSRLWDVAMEDEQFIREQLAIYEPDFVIACGSDITNILGKILPSDEKSWKFSFNGIRYRACSTFDTRFKKTSIIDFCHPSARSGNATSGIIAFGLRDAINEISNQKMISPCSLHPCKENT